MAALPTEVKAFIVHSLACFDTPSQVVKAVQAEFNLTITRQQVESHDPTKANGQKLAQKWVEFFHFTRERLQKEITSIPIANKACRLRSLDRMIAQAESSKNYSMAAQLIEQAAKECGDAYVNRKKP
ncbi:phage protein [Yersinia enterocolitica]|nr:phage protein [Yersinia enterocolitica]